LHSVLLTLWDVARDNPGYNRKLWGELQFFLTQLETRNNLLCALLSDLLHCTDDAGDLLWDEASIHSPPQGFGVKFMQEELAREVRPQMPEPDVVIPVDHLGEAVDPYDPIDALADVTPPPTSTVLPRQERLSADSSADRRGLKHLPKAATDGYDDGDESEEEDELAFEFDLSGSDDAVG
jgi:hypothetical protein